MIGLDRFSLLGRGHASTSGCSGASTIKVAPHNVSGRVVKTSIGSPCLGVEGNGRAFAAADPVGLHASDAFRPIECCEVQQLVGVFGDAEEPLVQVTS